MGKKYTFNELKTRQEEHERECKAAIDQFLLALIDVDRDPINQAAGVIYDDFVAPTVWENIATTQIPISETGKSIIQVRFLEDGDELREAAGDSSIFAKALRKALPPYVGPDIKLWRAENAVNHERKSYGLSWTSDQEVALNFTQAFYNRHAINGCVLLEALIPSNAIVCALCEQPGYDLGEHEYLVDPEQLGGINVIDRFEQMGLDYVHRTD